MDYSKVLEFAKYLEKQGELRMTEITMSDGRTVAFVTLPIPKKADRIAEETQKGIGEIGSIIKKSNEDSVKENKKTFNLVLISFLFAALGVILPLLQPLLGKCLDILIAGVLGTGLVVSFLYIKLKN